MGDSDGLPWVEKYRPTDLGSVVLDATNRRLLGNILKRNYFPNMLLYGPPGTGKTTTVINLVRQYQINNSNTNQGLMVHLNASDDRGVDTIRSQIHSFVMSKGLFSDGMKFVILDEVDYMTKNAQLALRCLLNSRCSENVRYCLICNYSSRIDASLQNDLIRLRFNQLPPSQIVSFLRGISESEKLHLSEEALHAVQRAHGSDIRSMINFLQTRERSSLPFKIVTDDANSVVADLFANCGADTEDLYLRIRNHCSEYQQSERAFIKSFFSYVVGNVQRFVTTEGLDIMSRLVHDKDTRADILLRYFVSSWSEFVRRLSR